MISFAGVGVLALGAEAAAILSRVIVNTTQPPRARAATQLTRMDNFTFLLYKTRSSAVVNTFPQGAAYKISFLQTEKRRKSPSPTRRSALIPRPSCPSHIHQQFASPMSNQLPRGFYRSVPLGIPYFSDNGGASSLRGLGSNLLLLIDHL